MWGLLRSRQHTALPSLPPLPSRPVPTSRGGRWIGSHRHAESMGSSWIPPIPVPPLHSPAPLVPRRYLTSKAGGGVAVTVLRKGYRLTTTRSIGSILCPAMASMCPLWSRTARRGVGEWVGGGPLAM